MKIPLASAWREKCWVARPVVGLLYTLAWGAMPSAWAQPGTWDASFPPSSLGGDLLAIQADGKILAGERSLYNPVYLIPIVLSRVNPDGGVDAGFAKISPDWFKNAGYLATLAVQADGKILLGGLFNEIHGKPVANLARLNADGTPDTAFQPPVMDPADRWERGGVWHEHGAVDAIAAQPDGAILIAGVFRFNGAAESQHLARLRPDGSLDSDFRITSLQNPFQEAPYLNLVPQPNGKILLGGGFSAVNGVLHSPLARLNPDGSLDETFQAPAITSAIVGLALQSDGRILVAGSFSNGTNSPLALLRLAADGTVDSSFNPTLAWQASVAGRLRCLKVQSDGRILVALNDPGKGPEYTPHDLIKRLLPDGSIDSSFEPNRFEAIGGSSVNTLALQANGQILVGGEFGQIPPISGTRIARLNGDAAPTISSAPVSQDGVPGGRARFSVTATGPGLLYYQWQQDGRNLVGETNTMLTMTNVQVADVGAYTVMVSNETGAVRSEAARLILPGVIAGSLDLAYDPGKTLFRGWAGSLFQINGNVITTSAYPPTIWEIDSEGKILHTFSAGISGGLTCSALQPDGKILLTYVPTSKNTNPMIRLNADGTWDPTFSFPGCGWNGCGFYGTVQCIAVQPDGKILAGGGFANFRVGLARMNTDGSFDNFFVDLGIVTARGNPALSQPGVAVNRLVLLPDGRMLFSAGFTDTNNVARTILARIHPDGSVDDSFYKDAGANAPIGALALDAAQRILIGGEFTQVQGVPRHHIARLLPDGQLDASFDPGVGPDAVVSCLAVQADGKVWMGGLFTHVDGLPWNHIALLNPDGGPNPDFNPGRGVEGSSVTSMVLQPDGDLVIGGNFSSYNGFPRNGLARIHGFPPTPVLLLSEPRRQNSEFSFRLQAAAGGRYAVRTSTNLVDWLSWTNVQLSGTSLVLTNPVSPTDTTPRFYRAMAE